MKSSDPDRLPRGLAPERFLRSQFGDWVARPWLDRAAFGGLHWYFPLSRLWAAASVADGDVGRFRAEVPLTAPPPGGWLLEQALNGVRQAVERYRRIDRSWTETFFFATRRPARRLVKAELERRTAARVWMAARGLLTPLLSRNVAPVRWAIPSPGTTSGRQAKALADPAAFYRPPDGPLGIEQSHRVPGPDGLESWLRFPSPGRDMADTAWAKIYEPEDAPADIPTVILCHGLAVESEMWGTTSGVPNVLVRAGIRVVAPEAPWHNRRMLPGRWGGEPMIATAPYGAPDLFQAALAEIAWLIAWSRKQESRAVALGGTSLGALTSQLAAAQAKSWPSPMRPDFLYLVTTGESVQQVAVDSELADVFGLGPALRKASWTDTALATFRPLTDPLGEPAMAADRIVMVLGRVDSVTRFDQGRQLATRWRVPEKNLFIRDQGHFSAAVGVVHDDAPLRRLLSLMTAAH